MSSADAQHEAGQEALEALANLASAAAAYTVYGGADEPIVARLACPVLPGMKFLDGVGRIPAIDVLRYLVQNYVGPFGATAGYACAECGTQTAMTYVVTQLDPEDDHTRTEVCRACDDKLKEDA